MTNKFPKPIINVKCGVCFLPLTWSNDLETFECVPCLLKLQHIERGNFQMVYTNLHAKHCSHLPPETYKKIRHLRQNNAGKKYFVIFAYTFFPCSLPLNHKGHHFFRSSCRYSEETIYPDDYEEKNVKDIELDT